MKAIARMTIMSILVVVGFIALFAEANHQLTGMDWLAVTIFSKAVAVAALLGCGALGRKWYGWDVELNK